MQAKENQQQIFNIVKENILAVPNQINRPTKAALQPAKRIVNTLGAQSGDVQNSQKLAQHSMKSNCLQVSKQSFDQTNFVPNVQKATKSTNALQARPNGHQQTNKGIQATKNEIVDGKVKKIVPKVNSGSKSKMKTKKAIKANGQKAAKKVPAKPTNQSQQVSKKADCDFVIFCDENDEPAIKAIPKENSQESAQSTVENKNEKKKGLTERNLKPQQQNVQINLQATVNDKQQEAKTSVEQLVTQTKSTTSIQTITTTVQQTTTTVQQTTTVLQTIQPPKSNDVSNIIKETVKEPVVSIDHLTLDETIETTLDEITLAEQSTIENKENDPTLMSIDLGKDEEMELSQLNQYKDVSGDMCCREFSSEIYLYMLKRELNFLADPTYMSKQPEINGKMRAMLVDWLIDVGIEYELENETVFLTISYIDQFLSSLTISLQNFQLLGTAALFIASKYEEIYPPELKDFIFVTDDAYTKLQMLSMEKLILKSLKFNVSPPTIMYFLRYFLTKLSLPTYVQYFAEYLCFLSLLHTDPFLSYSPSDIAISSIILALHTYTLTDVVNLEEFKQLTKTHFCKDDEGKLSDAKAILIRQSCVNAMYKLQKAAAEDAQQAVYTKYSSEKYLSVATVEIADEVPLVENFFN